MFKKNFISFFKKITLLTLLSFSALLMAINIPNFSSSTKSSPAVLFSSVAKTPQEIESERIKREVWSFLQENNRLHRLQTQENLISPTFGDNIQIISRTLREIKTDAKYENLTTKQTNTLLQLGQLDNYQDEIKTLLKSKTKKDDDASWGLIALSFSLPFLIFIFGFGFYRIKKLSIFKSKKPKK